MTGPLVALAVALADVLWVRYIRAVGAQRAGAAALWGAAIMGLGAWSVMQYVGDGRLVPWAILGAGVGTYVAVRLGR